MKEKKICWQLAYLPEKTPCFKMAGNSPCDADDCLVEKAIEEIPCIYQDLILRLCHSKCRISCVSEDNQEFLIRMSEKGVKHLLSAIE
ncbi:hypothetical protein KKD37_00010 [Patescibacteria group bacterium]|nr:hypothetical protein [Patescibacteria group bacterium]